MELVWWFQHATIYFFKLARCHCPCGPPFVSCLVSPWTNLWRNELKCSTVVQSCLRIKSSLCIATSPRFSSLIRLQFQSEVVSSLLLGFPNNDDIDWHQLTLMDMEIPWISHNYHFKIFFLFTKRSCPTGCILGQVLPTSFLHLVLDQLNHPSLDPLQVQEDGWMWKDKRSGKRPGILNIF